MKYIVIEGMAWKNSAHVFSLNEEFTVQLLLLRELLEGISCQRRG